MSRCKHCFRIAEGDADYCSYACRKFLNGEEIPCPHCDLSVKTVGRFRYHVNTNHRKRKPVKSQHSEPTIGHLGGSWASQREKALERDGRKCQLCGEENNLHVHHVLERSWFDHPHDSHWLGNLVTLCASCHRKVEILRPVDLFRLAHQD